MTPRPLSDVLSKSVWDAIEVLSSAATEDAYTTELLTPAERQKRRDRIGAACSTVNAALAELRAARPIVAAARQVVERCEWPESQRRLEWLQHLLGLAANPGAEVGEREPERQETDEELHARCAHPDYEYAETSGPRKGFDEHPPDGEDWERNTAIGDNGWDRFSYHEEAYWRRRRAKKGSGT